MFKWWNEIEKKLEKIMIYLWLNIILYICKWGEIVYYIKFVWFFYGKIMWKFCENKVNIKFYYFEC